MVVLTLLVTSKRKRCDRFIVEEREIQNRYIFKFKIVPLPPPPPGSIGESLKGPSNKVGGERKALVSDEGRPIGEGPYGECSGTVKTKYSSSQYLV